MATKNSFDTLVSQISDEERKLLLEKVQTVAKQIEDQTLSPPASEAVLHHIAPIKDELRQQRIFVRLWVFIRSFLTGESAVSIYNRDKVSRIASEISHTYIGLIDYKKELLLTSFFTKLKEFKSCADFFRPYFETINSDIGAFYAYLGIFLLPGVTERIKVEADPFIYPIELDVPRDRRTVLLRKMDQILQEITPNARKSMYNGAVGIEWLRQFVNLPFERFLNLFTNPIDDNYVCSFQSIGNELGLFAKILCADTTVTGEILQALYLYKNNTDEGLDVFLNDAQSRLASMRIFIVTVPCHSIAAIVYNDASWQPDTFGGAEDWFIKYKEEWKKVFDSRWSLWLQSCKKETQRHALHHEFGLEAFPMLPNRPWSTLWGGLPFRYELTAGFLFWFMTAKFSSVSSTLKMLVLNGIFSYDNNKEELVSALDSFSSIELDINQFDSRFSSSGETGLLFDRLSSKKLRTLQWQQKVDSMIMAAEKEIQNIQAEFCSVCRTFVFILRGVFEESDDKKYGTVKNLRLIKTNDDGDFSAELHEVKVLIQNALEMISQIENIDAASSKPQAKYGVYS